MVAIEKPLKKIQEQVMSEQTLKLIIHDVIEDGNDVILLDLRAEDQSDLPEFSAGARSPVTGAP